MTRLSAILFLLAASAVNAERAPPPPNARIDPQAFLAVAADAMQHRKTRRVEEREFLRMRNEPGTIILRDKGSASFIIYRHSPCPEC